MNNPSVSAYAEALRLFPEEDDFLLVSMGTGELARPISYDKAKSWGKLDWAQPILDVVIDGIGDAAHYQLTHILGDKYVRLQTGLTDAADRLDDTSAENLDLLRREAEKLLTTHRARLQFLFDELTVGLPGDVQDPE